MTTKSSKSQFLSVSHFDRLLFATKQLPAPPNPAKDGILLGQLIAHEHSQWSHLFSERQYAAGEIIFWENEPGDSMYIVQSGRAVVIKGELSNPVILDCHKKGESIGEMALLEGSPRSASVIALEPVNLLEINRENFFELLRASDTFSQGIMRLLSARLRDTSDAVQRETMQKIRDPLTGLYNRYYMRDVLKHELERAARVQYPVSVIILDLDHFKKVNDTYGHLSGDQVLRSLSELILAHVRRADVACRYGGEEFLIILPETPAKIALERAETIRADFEQLHVEYGGQKLHVTVSLGVASFPDHGLTPDQIIQAADIALYTAKAKGRNQTRPAKKLKNTAELKADLVLE
jgi:diguanylate cyclase (GGDEF)-like protein